MDKILLKALSSLALPLALMLSLVAKVWACYLHWNKKIFFMNKNLKGQN